MQIRSAFDSCLSIDTANAVLTIVGTAAGCILLLETADDASNRIKIYSVNEKKFRTLKRDEEINGIISSPPSGYIIKSWPIQLTDKVRFRENSDDPDENISLRTICEQNYKDYYFEGKASPSILRDFDIVFTLVYHEGVAAKSFDKNIALLNAAENGHIDLAKKCIELKADINTMASLSESIFSFFKIPRWTPVMYAASKGHMDMVRYLTEQGASLDASNFTGENVFYLAKKTNNKIIFLYLYCQKYIPAFLSTLVEFTEVPAHHRETLTRIDACILELFNSAHENLDSKYVQPLLSAYVGIVYLLFTASMHPKDSSVWLNKNINALIQRHFFIESLFGKYSLDKSATPKYQDFSDTILLQEEVKEKSEAYGLFYLAYYLRKGITYANTAYNALLAFLIAILFKIRACWSKNPLPKDEALYTEIASEAGDQQLSALLTQFESNWINITSTHYPPEDANLLHP